MNALAAWMLAAAAALPLDWPLLSKDDPEGKTVSAVELRGWAASGALIYVTETLGSDDVACPPSDFQWDVRLLVIHAGAKEQRYRLTATGDHGLGASPIAGDVNAERKKSGCAAPAAAVDEYDGSAEGGEKAAAAEGPLGKVCDLARPCPSPSGKMLRLVRKSGPADADHCHDQRISLELAGRTLWQTRGRDCASERLIEAKAAWSSDGRNLAVAWNVSRTGLGYSTTRLYGRLDLFSIP